MEQVIRGKVKGKRLAARIILLSVFVLAAWAQFAAGQWSTVGGDTGNTRYSSLAQIDSQNVAKLGAAWVSEKVGPAPTSRSMPVVDNGLMFLTAPPFVYAVNLGAGKIAWRFSAMPGGMPAREGVAVGEGLVFVGLSNANLVALREETGEVVWKTYLGDPMHEPSAGASGAPPVPISTIPPQRTRYNLPQPESQNETSGSVGPVLVFWWVALGQNHH